MKASILCLVLFVSFNSYCQSVYQQDVFLRQYSYSLFGVKIDSPKIYFYSGTGFFITGNSGLFLITAKHVMSGCNTTTEKKIANYTDTMQLFIPTLKYPILISTVIAKDTSSCLDFEKDADVITVKMNDTLVNYVNTVNRFVLPLLDTLGEIEIYGNPFKMFDTIPMSPDKFRIHELSEQYKLCFNYPDSNKIIQTLNYILYAHDLDVNITQGVYEGYSGSPFFIQDGITHKYRLAGIFVGGVVSNNTEFNGLYITKIENIYPKIDYKVP